MSDTSWMVWDYPEPPPDPPGPLCDRCGEYLSEIYYITDTGENICDHCFEEEVSEISLEKHAELLGYDRKYTEDDFL